MTMADVSPRTLDREQVPEVAVKLSVVIPARNEAAVIQRVISTIPVPALVRDGFDVEIIVVDNASDDATGSLARSSEATVISESRRGYGRALRTGLSHAQGAILVMSDGDGTYPLEDIARLVTPLLEGQADLVTGSRLRGNILPKAMPYLHRYVGVPVLTSLVNLLFGLRLTDGHCGMRTLTREALNKMRLTSNGMEFATEMLIRARQVGLRIAEIPIEYRPRSEATTSKLRSFADGWQHLTFILREFATPLWRQALVATGLAALWLPPTEPP